MTHKRAHRIINSTLGVSELTNDWKFVKDEGLFLYSELLDVSYSISEKTFVKHYFLNYKIVEDKIIGEYRYSSVGLISDEEYYLALDLMEGDSLKSSELENGKLYLSKNGKEYFYLENLDIKFFVIDRTRIFKETFVKGDYLVQYLGNDKYGRIIKKGSVKLLEEVDFEGEFSLKEVLKNYTIPYYIDKNIYKVPTIKFNEYFNEYSISNEIYDYILYDKNKFEKDFIGFMKSSDIEFPFKFYVKNTRYLLEDEELPF